MQSLKPVTKRRFNPRFLGDINTPALDSPTSRRNCLRVIRFQNETLTKKMKLLKQRNKRLETKVSSLKGMLKDLEQRRLISEHASAQLWVSSFDMK